MTHTTPEAARKSALNDCFSSVQATALLSLADQLEAVTADCERFANQAFAVNAEAETLVGRANSEVARLTAERDALAKDAALWRAYMARKTAVIAAGMGSNPLRAADAAIEARGNDE